MVHNDDTIVAMATPPGKGGVGIVRVSGPLVPFIAQKMLGQVPKVRQVLFVPFKDIENKDTKNEHIENDASEILDHGIALYFKAPNSFTGEDVLELQGHGGPIVMDSLIQATLKGGARLAKPGEFSLRAFLNNKLDLSQAEAVSDLINADSIQQARSALKSLQGDFSKQITEFIDETIKLRMYIEASLDFPDEEIDFLKEGQVQKKILDLLERLQRITHSAENGLRLSSGFKIVIAGKPNAGKSSLLNLLSGYDAAIVTDIPGTTRDILKEEITLDGMVLQISDTAGFRDNADVIEQQGIKRAKHEISLADHLIWVVDGSVLNGEENRAEDFEEKIKEILKEQISILKESILKEAFNQNEKNVQKKNSSYNEAFNNNQNLAGHLPVTIFVNKLDAILKRNLSSCMFLNNKFTSNVLSNNVFLNNMLPNSDMDGYSLVFGSVKTGEGIPSLRAAIKDNLSQKLSNETQFSARSRHLKSLNAAKDHLLNANQMFVSTFASEILAEELKLVQQALEEITGKFTTDDLLGKIFSEFCIGK